jgi:mono/diheme cytochrome c family protein
LARSGKVRVAARSNIDPAQSLWREGRKMMRAVIFASILAASASAANAQDTSGNPAAGRVYARRACSPCHAVTAEQASRRTIAIGPDFQTIANTSGLTATALRAFLQTPHPKMPNLILTPEQSADVIAFVLSLRDRRQPESKP